MTQCRQQQALAGFAGYDGRSGVASLANSWSAVEPQASLDVLGGSRVAFVAVLDQHRPDLRFEELDVLVRRGERRDQGDQVDQDEREVSHGEA